MGGQVDFLTLVADRSAGMGNLSTYGSGFSGVGSTFFVCAECSLGLLRGAPLGEVFLRKVWPLPRALRVVSWLRASLFSSFPKPVWNCFLSSLRRGMAEVTHA